MGWLVSVRGSYSEHRPPLDGVISWGMRRWEERHAHMNDMQYENRRGDLLRDAGEADTYIEVAPWSKPIDEPRPSADVKDTSRSVSATYSRREKRWRSNLGW